MSFIKSTISNAMEQKSVMRIVNASLALLFLTSLTLNIASSNESADALVKRQCKSPNTGVVHNLSSADFQPASIVASGSTATATFKFPGYCAGQNIDIALVSYKAPNTPDNQPFSAQRVHDVRTESYNVPRGDAKLTVNLPSCKYQVDLVLGGKDDVIERFSDGHGSPNTYTGQGRMITAIGGGSGECFPQAPAPAPAPQPQAPAPVVNNTCVNNSCNVTTIDQTTNNDTEINNSPGASVNTQQGNAASASSGSGSSGEAEVDQEITVEQTSTNEAVKAKTKVKANESEATVTYGKGTPKELPNTGPGMIATIGFGTTFMSSFLFSARGRYSEMLAKLIARF